MREIFPFATEEKRLNTILLILWGNIHKIKEILRNTG